jgi:flagellar hook assembly protein FlgD
MQNYPNPFNPGTTIRYVLPNPSRVTLRIYNILGQIVRTLVDGSQYGGQFDVSWDGRTDGGIPVATGVYIYRLEASGIANPAQSITAVKKMLLIH